MRLDRQSVNKKKRNGEVLLALLSLPALLTLAAYGYILNSDIATTYYLAKDMAEGNFLLKDWVLTTTSFYFTDRVPMAFWALFHQPPMNTLVMGGAAHVWLLGIGLYLLLRDEILPAPFWTGFLAFAAAAHLSVFTVPVHIGTFLLGIWGALCFYSKRRGHFPAAALLLALALSSDMYAFMAVWLPLLLETIWFSLKGGAGKGGLLSLAAALLLGQALSKLQAHLGLAVPGLSGGFALHHPLDYARPFLDSLLGAAGLFPYSLGTGDILARSGAGLLAVCALLGILWGLRQIHLPEERHLRFLVLIPLLVLPAVLVLGLPVNYYTGRYLLAPYAVSVLLFFLWASRSFPALADRKAVLMAAFLGLFLAGFSACRGAIFQPVFEERQALMDRVDAALQKRHLPRWGYAEYWDASGNEIFSAAGTRILPVLPREDGLIPMLWFSKPTDYRCPASFVVLRHIRKQGDSRRLPTEDALISFGADDAWTIDHATAERIFGEPTERIESDHYTVYIYDYDISKKLKG